MPGRRPHPLTVRGRAGSIGVLIIVLLSAIMAGVGSPHHAHDHHETVAVAGPACAPAPETPPSGHDHEGAPEHARSTTGGPAVGSLTPAVTVVLPASAIPAARRWPAHRPVCISIRVLRV
ncbi:hypothetical protein [Jidongwangia harbinensis]|uniref:hypothetical protein n=1 Tax=Jidongwangia harbinensis TaxID=2878561 RepID=UPI001CDA3FF2|nr:hypothetical protein [Jidongwangia harbinensis]MCA2211562.1 hypothetical protein [Jidongwangia harbinensis]